MILWLRLKKKRKKKNDVWLPESGIPLFLKNVIFNSHVA